MPIATNKKNAKYFTVETPHIAVTAGTGYSIGDSISVIRLLSQDRGKSEGVLYWNNTTGLEVTPTLAHLRPLARHVAVLILQDNTPTPFLRHIVYESTGAFVTSRDTALDGTTPFVPTGAVVPFTPA